MEVRIEWLVRVFKHRESELPLFPWTGVDPWRALQQSYIDDSEFHDLVEWAGRSEVQRFLEIAFRLASPLL